ncbi:LysR family transcriptional regulator [Sandaracinus amylolyticus]|nr:LysR family transcriptional regulator [Sandaracinus amylolyticus]
MNRKLDDVMLGTIELFCSAAELGSFTAAAQRAGVTPAAVSRSISRLEERLGVRLFVRTTRRIRLTDAGATYAQSCRRALSQIADAERDVSGRQSTPTGLVRVSVPTTYGHHRLLPRLPAFRARHPGVRVDVHVSNRNVTFAHDDYDVAIRVRAQRDSSLVVRKLEDAELVLVASPAYLARAGTPRCADDLHAHECIQFELPSSGRHIPWPLRIDGTDVEVETRGSYACSDDVLGGVTLALAGAGIFQTYRFVVEQPLAEGRLVEVLPALRGPSRPFNLLHPHGRRLPTRVRAFIDFLLEDRRDS